MAGSQPNSFHWPIMMMPNRQRKATLALYNFCRTADDAIDELGGTQTALDDLRAECDRMFDGTPRLKASQKLAPFVEEFQLEKKHFESLFEGFEMDISGQMMFPTRELLNDYCERVACAPGYLVLKILGCDTPSGYKAARQLGQAMQRTNILRDVRHDAKIGRCYFPREIVPSEFTIPKQFVLDKDILRMARKKLGEETMLLYESINMHISSDISKNMAPALLMRDVYLHQFRKMESSSWKMMDRDKVIKASNMSLPMVLAKWSYYRMSAA